MKKKYLSSLASGMSPLSISGISDKIRERVSRGEKIFNFTLGDFNPEYFPVPQKLEDEIVKAYRKKLTNYPVVGGMDVVRESVSRHIKRLGGFDYSSDEIIIGSGSRPLTYILFRTLLDEGDKVINVVPSWNNYNYIYLSGAEKITVESKPGNNFMITAEEIVPHLSDASLIALNSPLNPSGTAFGRQQLKEIVDAVVEENRTRKGKKPLYVFFDIVYWLLTYGDTVHYNPVELNPEIRPYIVFIDGISKCFSATGVRLGWAFGPENIISKMKSIIAHIGAWSPKPEQVAVSEFLNNNIALDEYLASHKRNLLERLNIFYDSFIKLKRDGYNMDVIKPQGAIYLSVKIDLIGRKTSSGKILKTVDDIFEYLVDEGKTALVPFYAFGSSKTLPWFRLSVGTCGIYEAILSSEMISSVTKKLQ